MRYWQRFRQAPRRGNQSGSHPVRNVVLPFGFVALVSTLLGAIFSGFGGRGANDLGAVLFILGGVLWIAWVLLVVLLMLRGIWRALRRLVRRYGLRRYRA